MYDRDLFGSMFFWLNWIVRTCPDIGIVSRSLGVMTVTCGGPAATGAGPSAKTPLAPDATTLCPFPYVPSKTVILYRYPPPAVASIPE
jgi:hypothetical protein